MAPSVATRLDEDTTVITPSGATLLAPKGWWLTQHDDVVTLTDPERALHVTLLEIHDAAALNAIARTMKATTALGETFQYRT